MRSADRLRRWTAPFFTAQFLRFLFVGATAAGLHWLARFWLDAFMSFSLAVILAYGVGIAVAFTLNAVFVFPGSDRPVARQMRDFVLINVGFFPVVWAASLALRWAFTRLGVLDIADDLAHAVAIAIPVFGTFLLYKFVAFAKGATHNP